MVFLVTGAQLEAYPKIRDAMYRMRHKIFYEELGWDVTSDNGLEYDQFDRPDTVYILYLEGDRVIGTWRLLPTTQPYMMSHVFSDLLPGEPPSDKATWELSRYAIDMPEITSRAHFRLVGGTMFCALCEFCMSAGVMELVAVQEPSITKGSNQSFGYPYLETEPVQYGKASAQVVYYRPSFHQQHYNVGENLGLRLPVAPCYDIGAHSHVQLQAAE